MTITPAVLAQNIGVPFYSTISLFPDFLEEGFARWCCGFHPPDSNLLSFTSTLIVKIGRTPGPSWLLSKIVTCGFMSMSFRLHYHTAPSCPNLPSPQNTVIHSFQPQGLCPRRDHWQLIVHWTETLLSIIDLSCKTEFTEYNPPAFFNPAGIILSGTEKDEIWHIL